MEDTVEVPLAELRLYDGPWKCVGCGWRGSAEPGAPVCAVCDTPLEPDVEEEA